MFKYFSEEAIKKRRVFRRNRLRQRGRDWTLDQIAKGSSTKDIMSYLLIMRERDGFYYGARQQLNEYLVNNWKEAQKS